MKKVKIKPQTVTQPRDLHLIPEDAHSFEVFAIKPSGDSQTGLEAYIGYKTANGNFNYAQAPYTGSFGFHGMKKGKRTPEEILCEIYECDIDDLEFIMVSSEMTHHLALRAMKLYMEENCQALIETPKI